MKNLFTFEDMTGKRRLRSFVKVAIGAFVLIVAIGVVNAVNRNRMMHQIFAEPRPVSAEALPTAEVVIEQPTVVEECPTDPADWTLTENLSAPGSNLKKLSTECVYNELEKAAAWVYATTHLGYTRSDAAVMLGLQNPLIVLPPDGLIAVLTDYRDEPQQVSIASSVPNPDFSEWRVNADGKVISSFTFSGCFSTSSISGGEVVNWGSGYPIVCQFFADYQTEYVVSSINGNVATLPSVFSVRRPMWFGYSGAGNWVWLGAAKGWDVDLSQIPSRGKATLDAGVMAEKYGITAIPLPNDWKTFTDQEHINAVVVALNGEQ